MNQETGTVSVISGSAKNAVLVSNTGSNSRWRDFKIESLKAELSTAGLATVDADIIAVEVSTGGHLKYRGKPEIKTIEVSTGGSISQVK